MATQNKMTTLGRNWRALAYVLNICRFSLLVLLAVIVLLNVGQGQDLLLSIGEDNRYFLLLGSCLLWATSIWLFTRTLLEIRFPDSCVDWELLAIYRRWLPRVLGGLAFLGVAFAMRRADAEAVHLFWPTIILGAVFLYLISKRRNIGQWLAHKLNKQSPEQSMLWVGFLTTQEPMYANWHEALSDVLGKIAIVLFIGGIVMFIWGVYSPISMGGVFNTLALLMLWSATFLPLGSAITYLANKTGLPLLSLIFIMVLVFSNWNDNHAIRPVENGITPDARPHIHNALKQWKDEHCTDTGCDPFVVVATAGGGIRAAYWTGTVLGHLHQKSVKDPLENEMFAISGVSGGSLGALVYRAIIADSANDTCKDRVMECIQNVLARDFLAPVSASLLYPDLVQRFIPVPYFTDRAATLEKSWEIAYQEETGSNLLATSFVEFAKQNKAWPALFLNATWSNNGRRIVASTLRTDTADIFNRSNDQLKRIKYDIRLSTAAHNSARFPYVSPPGSWHAGKNADVTSGNILGRLQDGGLFENYGAETALEILQLAKLQMGERFNPFVIMITSDPTLPMDLAESESGKVSNLAYELMTTVYSLVNSREGHGKEAASRLKDYVSSPKQDRFAYFRMCKTAKDEKAPPLGWALSQNAKKVINQYLFAPEQQESQTHIAENALTISCRKENQQSVQLVLNRK